MTKRNGRIAVAAGEETAPQLNMLKEVPTEELIEELEHRISKGRLGSAAEAVKLGDRLAGVCYKAANDVMHRLKVAASYKDEAENAEQFYLKNGIVCQQKEIESFGG